MAGEPAALITQALTLDPNNEHAIWLAAIAQQQIGDHDAALQGFNRLANMAQDNPQALSTIEEMRSRSIAAMAGLQQNDVDTPVPGDNKPTTSPSANATGGSATSEQSPAQEAPAGDDATQDVSVTVTVGLSDQAQAASTDDQVVFVYARATDGPPMPLAVSRLSVADLPTTITLDNSMAMIPTMTLSTFPSVTVGARVSASGEAIAQSGDWYTEATNIDPASTESIDLTIDVQTP
jgi:cytochrome c-type biogenesis protein CcmH